MLGRKRVRGTTSAIGMLSRALQSPLDPSLTILQSESSASLVPQFPVKFFMPLLPPFLGSPSISKSCDFGFPGKSLPESSDPGPVGSISSFLSHLVEVSFTTLWLYPCWIFELSFPGSWILVCPFSFGLHRLPLKHNNNLRCQ